MNTQRRKVSKSIYSNVRPKAEVKDRLGFHVLVWNPTSTLRDNVLGFQLFGLSVLVV